MKISITIDMLPSEVMAFLRPAQKPEAEKADPPVPSLHARVADCEKNQNSAYWKARIGDEASIIPAGPNQVQAHFEGDAVPLYNVDLDRFIPI